MRNKSKTNENYLDYIPKKSSKISTKYKEEGTIQLIVPRDSILERAVRKIFFTPDSYKIDLDEFGSFIWENIDGEKTVYQIAELLKNEFGDRAEPLYDRLIKFMVILENNKFISISNKDRKS
ncbi:MAG: PqqD family protein [Tissierellales bacterium]|nr:PqqD family protein [Tissierellales bacterium]